MLITKHKWRHTHTHAHTDLEIKFHEYLWLIQDMFHFSEQQANV